jgi:hypothetical protein
MYSLVDLERLLALMKLLKNHLYFNV